MEQPANRVHLTFENALYGLTHDEMRRIPSTPPTNLPHSLVNRRVFMVWRVGDKSLKWCAGKPFMEPRIKAHYAAVAA